MSIISSIYNQGTGLITPISEGQLPIIVDDLTVNGNLTVLGTSNLVQDVTCGDNLIVAQTTTTQNLVVNNNTILDNGVGQNNSALFKLPLRTWAAEAISEVPAGVNNKLPSKFKVGLFPTAGAVTFILAFLSFQQPPGPSVVV